MSATNGIAPFPVPSRPMGLDEVLGSWPTVRQSVLSKYDDCALSALFQMRYARGYSTHPQSRGVLFHRYAAECIREMKRHDSETIPAGVARAILEETLRQTGVPPAEIVRLPLRELPDLEMEAAKFARDNRFNIRNVVGTETPFAHTLSYRRPDGRLVERLLTGRPDTLVATDDGGAAIIDWKSTWQLPPERDESADDPGISYGGYFQQQFYGWLVMREYPTLKYVSLREFYARRSKVRKARLERSELPRVELRLAVLVEAFDRAIEAGPPRRLTVEAIEEHGHWKPTPGKHCAYCPASRLCPIEDEAGMEPAIRSEADAARAAGELQVAKAIVKHRERVLRPWVDLHGPIPIKDAKGRRVLGYRKRSNGSTAFETFTPTSADRPSSERVASPDLVDAMKESTERARNERSRTGPGMWKG